MKPDNMILGFNNDREIHLLDFSVSKKYVLPTGEHVPRSEAENFVGHIVFASKNQFRRLGKL